MKNLFKKDKNTEVPENGAEVTAPENGAVAKSKPKLDKRMILIICAACLAVICIVLAIVLPICLTGGGDTYYTLSYDGSNPDGVKIVIKNEDGADAGNGWEVKSGVTVNFALEYEGEREGEPIVLINGNEVKANGEGIYSFTMDDDTTIKISGVFVKMNYKVTFDGGDDNWVRYSSDAFDVSEPVSVMGGEQVTFDVSVSVYYKQAGYTVVANTTVVKPDEQGHYTFTVIGNTTVSVRDLVQEDPFSARINEENNTVYMDGEGTAANPYKIRKAIDLYAMADFVGNDFYASDGYNMAYYELMNDIDMQGERLYIIGDGFTTAGSIFAGNFNGGGHTISNYYIADQIIEQEGFTRVFTPYIGLFGVAAATTSGPAEIYDLNLKNFTIEVTHTNKTGFFVGGLVGMGEGVNITNCSAQGTITAKADPDYRSVMGGMVGYLRAVSNGTVSYPSVVRSCSADVEVGGESGFIECAGGLVGHVISYDAVTPAYILNSYSTGNVYGAVRTGGVAGAVSAYSSIKNSYSTGLIEAKTTESRPGMDEYYHAYAGGVAGYVDYGAIISDSFSTGEIFASATENRYAVTDGVAAYVNTADSIPAGAYPALVLNSVSVSATEHGTQKNDINNRLIQNILKWGAADWTFVDGQYPAVNQEIVDNVTYTVTVSLSGGTVSGANTYEVTLTDIYSDMAGLYVGVYVGDNRVTFPQYLNGAVAGSRTYGYYFDSALTQRIPNSFVPTTDMTVYAKFVDYNYVAGTYYIQNGVNGSSKFYDYKDVNNVYSLETPLEKGAYIKLNADGTLEYRNGVISSESTYYYDGVRLTLEEVYVNFEESYTLDENDKQVVEVNSFYATLNAVHNNGNLDIYDGQAYKQSAPLKAVKAISGFDYGYYYKGNTTYRFYPDMTGEKTEGSVTTAFDYIVSGSAVTIGADTLTIGTGADELKKFDAYYGTWEKSAGSNKRYTFDGKGGYAYEYFGYNANGDKVVYDSATGTYDPANGTVNGTISLSIKDGLLSIGGETYYKQNSFAGSWHFPHAGQNSVPVDITFGGISALGYGEAVVDYGTYYGTVKLGYHSVSAADGTVTIELYNGDYLYGSLVYNPAEKTLEGSIISAAGNDTAQAVMIDNAKFFLFDDFKGSWVSSDTGFELINFNGLGNYETKGTDVYLAASGQITVDGAPAGTYKLVSGKLEGTLVKDGTTYLIKYDEQTKLITVTPESGTAITLVGFDGWQNIVLAAEDGTEYKFDGRGNIAGNGGKVIVTPASGTATEYNYGMSNGMPTINTLGDIAEVAGNYTLGGTTKLWIKTEFGAAQNWLYQNDTALSALSIGKIGPDGNGGYVVDKVIYLQNVAANGTVSGGTTVNNAKYDLEHNEIYVEDADGNVTLSISVMSGDGETALSFEYISNNQINSHICIAGLDGYVGEYTAKEGKIVFDGFGVSEFATGYAREYGAEGKVSKTYTYTVEDGEIKLTHTVRKGNSFIITEYIFDEVTEDAYEYEKGGKHYSVVEIDELYKLAAYKKVSFNKIDKSVKYTFDGIGGIVANAVSTESGEEVLGAVLETYKYEIISYSSLMMTYTLYVTDAAGKIYSGELNLSSDNALSLTEKDRFYNVTVYGVDDAGKVDETARYSFDGNGTGTLTYVHGEDVTTYNYKLVEDKGNVCTFEVTLPNDQSKKFTGVLTFEDKVNSEGEKVNTFTLTEVTA